MSNPIRMAVLISGGGRTMLNFDRLIKAGQLNAGIAVVVSSRADAGGVEKARAEGLKTIVLPRKQFTTAEGFSEAMTRTLEPFQPELITLAGFLSLYRFPVQYAWRVMNVHPALLPKFGGQGMYGHHVHEAVLAAGEKESGCTVHFADNEYDKGPIILQRTCPVLPGDTPDTLADRVFEQELIAYPEAVNLFAGGRLKIVSGRVFIA